MEGLSKSYVASAEKVIIQCILRAVHYSSRGFKELWYSPNILYLSVKGVMTSRGVLPRYS